MPMALPGGTLHGKRKCEWRDLRAAYPIETVLQAKQAQLTILRTSPSPPQAKAGWSRIKIRHAASNHKTTQSCARLA